MTTPTEKPLYERLGGFYPIASVVDDFLTKVLVDPIINSNKKVADARARLTSAGFKYIVTEMVCWATGGPQKYSGIDMKSSHATLDINEAEWKQFAALFQETLDKFSVPAKEQQELFAIVGSTKADIVIKP